VKRRDFIAGIGALAAWPFGVRAQQPVKMKRIAIVSPATKVGDMNMDGIRVYRAFFEELGRVGYVEGRNLVVERYSGEGRTERFDSLVREVVSTSPDLIFPVATVLALKFKMATSTIPIVAMTGDPVASGLVSSMARPGGNITGATVDAGSALHGKRVELLVEASPRSSNARFLGSQSSWDNPGGSAVREAARQAGISLAISLLDSNINEAAYQRVFNAMGQDRVDALVVADQPENFTYRRLLVELAAKHRIPAIYPFREHAELGGLMSYSADLSVIFRRIANQIAEVLRGIGPAEIPVYQPTKFQLIINLKTAKALGLELPATLLARADEAIE
jgi:putative tryptophan/tyrosine transport system substrate-binding protein